MSTLLPMSSIDTPSTAQRKSGMPAWLREPLLHFVILGGLLFVADHFISGRANDPNIIVVGPEVDAEARQIFKAARNREPSAGELEGLRRVWLDNEILYREGLALKVDKGDQSIRDRVIFKALSIVDANVKLPPFDDKVLHDWFESHRDKYDEPARFDFQEAALSGDNSEPAVRAFVAALNAGTPGDAKAGLRVFKGRPLSNLLQSYGADFAKLLEASPVGEWRAIQTKDGWRAIQFNAVTQPKAAAFESLHSVVQQDWTDAVMAEQRTAAVRALAKKYTLKLETAAK